MNLLSHNDVEDLVINPGRLRILTSLTGSGSLEFVQLRSATGLTDGNLASHTRRLSSAGLVGVDKQIRSGKPVTTITLTPEGRAALKNQVERLTLSIASAHRIPTAVVDNRTQLPNATDAEDWID